MKYGQEADDDALFAEVRTRSRAQQGRATLIPGYHCEEDLPLGFHCWFRKWVLRTRLMMPSYTAALMPSYNSLICMSSSLIAQVEYQWREDRSPKRAHHFDDVASTLAKKNSGYLLIVMQRSPVLLKSGMHRFMPPRLPKTLHHYTTLH